MVKLFKGKTDMLQKKKEGQFPSCLSYKNSDCYQYKELFWHILHRCVGRAQRSKLPENWSRLKQLISADKWCPKVFRRLRFSPPERPGTDSSSSRPLTGRCVEWAACRRCRPPGLWSAAPDWRTRSQWHPAEARLQVFSKCTVHSETCNVIFWVGTFKAN